MFSIYTPTIEPQFPMDLIANCLTSNRVHINTTLEMMRRWDSWEKWIFGEDFVHNQFLKGEQVIEFVNRQLTSEEKVNANGWAEGLEDNHFHEIVNELAQGYKITFSFDLERSCFIVSLIGRDKVSPNFNKCMTTRHGNLEQCVILALYKQRVLFADGNWDVNDHTSEWG